MPDNTKTPSKGGWFERLGFGRIGLILWKNLQYRKTRFIMTLTEILVPVLLVIIIVVSNYYYTREQAKQQSPQEGPELRASTNQNETIWTIDKLVEQYTPCFPPCNKTLAYHPPEAKGIVMKLAEALKTFRPLSPLFPTRVDFEFTVQLKSDDEIEMFVVDEFLHNDKIRRESETNRTQENRNSESDPEKYVAAIIFTKESVSSGKLGPDISYTIRLPNAGLSYEPVDTAELYKKEEGSTGGHFGGNWYTQSGFTLFQLILDNLLIQNLAKVGSSIPSIQVLPFPRGSGKGEESFNFVVLLAPILSVCLTIGFMFMIPSIVLVIVSEKKSGIKELMKMMGLPNWIHWLGWMLNSMIIHVITVSLIVLLLFISFGSGSKPVFQKSDGFFMWISLILYAMAATAFCFFLSALFQSPIVATLVGLVVWVVSYFATVSAVNPRDHNRFVISDVLTLALIPNYALYLLLVLAFRFESQDVGAQWSNMAEPLNSVMPLAMYQVWLMFLADTIVYTALAIYLENILPTEFGVRKPWHYIFSPFFCMNERLSKKIDVEHTSNNEAESTTGFEKEPTGLNAGIIVTNLSKQFGHHRKVVNNLSFKMYDGQITALLGHNGAGKTTTMSILTGLIAPTSGTATINGFDIRTQIDEVRSSLGLCPQHNLLFDNLSVRVHLIFFGRLKGLTWAQAESETSSLLQLIGMPEKAKVPSSKLSGGQKRKLCLAMALIGGTKVLILDEPTSGMDPEARRAIWDVLLAMRGSRTILLTTHFMDEADVLGDRIAIMAAGKLQCCGSPEYLKRFYGAGFTLSMIIDPNADKNAIMALVQQHSPEASLKYKKFSTDSELGITLPSKEGKKSEFSPLFSELTKKKQDLGILSVGLTMITMDDVFIKVGELLEGDDAESYQASAVQTGGESAPKSKGCFCLVLLQFWALFQKRLLYTWRSKLLFIAQVAIPLLLVYWSVSIANRQFKDPEQSPKLTMKLSDYRDPKTLYNPVGGLGTFYKTVVGSSGEFVENVKQGLLDAQEKDLTAFKARYIVAADLVSSVTAFYSIVASHATPLSVNLVSNAILKSKIEGSIEVSNQPLEHKIHMLKDFEGDRGIIQLRMAYMYSVMVPLGFALFAGFTVVFPIEENICQGKQLQVMTGVNPLIFWGSSFIWDLIMVLILAGLTVLVLSLHNQEVFTRYDAGGVIFLIVIAFGLTIIPFCYVCSLFLKSPAGGFAFVAVFNAFFAMTFGALIVFLEGSQFLPQTTGLFALIFRIVSLPLPLVGFTITIVKYGEIAYENAKCNFIPEDLREVVCSLTFTKREPLYPELYHCCRTCEESIVLGACNKPYSFLTWTLEHRTPKPGIPQELLYLCLVGIFYTTVLLVVEFKLFGKLKSVVFKGEHNRPPTDEDVIMESQRVHEMIATGQVGRDALVAGDICKSFGSLAAVSNLSFGVHHGECFGLLGVNGAGKTTAFRILTGDETASGGNAYAFNLTLNKNRRRFLGNIGYCPQFDGIIGVLTGREMLELYARLRGIQAEYISSQATLWLKKTGLYDSRNEMSKNYSGGMKRRLSAGMAMIAEPRIIMLDEPTSGVDPVSRRRFWDVLAEARNSGQSVILTSHSMEECEALCSRMGIMVNGQFQCFGTVDHLKTKFAQGFSLLLKLKPLIPPDSPELAALQQEILQRFEPCQLKDQHQNVLQYQIYNTNVGWDVLFEQMEDIKTRNEELMEEYSVNETTLEEVFLSFTRQQYPERVVPVSCFKKCILCQC